MRFSRCFVIFSYGLFSIAAQALLFREFITSFEDNDISVGIFFASWFLWVGGGALLVNKAERLAARLLDSAEFAVLYYLPAFILELVLIIQARQIAGIESYAFVSVRAIVLLSVIVNAPVSVVTGMLFPVLCRWVQQKKDFAISTVYIFEAAGSFVGGLGTTVLLWLGASLAQISLLLVFVLSLSVFSVLIAGLRYAGPDLAVRKRFNVLLMLLVSICTLVCLAARIDQPLMRYVRSVKWCKLLPKSAFVGALQTPQAEYLYGVYHEQWVAVREGSVVEAVPDEESSGRIAAIVLCQNPKAERVLVVGTGLGICRQLLRLPQIEHVAWGHSDTEYAQKANSLLPPQLRISDQRFSPIAEDVRLMLGSRENYYDIVVVNLPEATSSVLNRYYTVEFYEQVRRALRPGGAVGVKVSGGENIMGTELVNLGASTKLTLEKVFSHFVLAPGDESWFIASDSNQIAGEPGRLRERFSGINGAEGIFPSEGLMSIYLPDRAAKAMDAYASADLPKRLLINRDARPLTHLYSLLFAARQSEATGTRFFKYLALAGTVVFIVPILVFVVLRVIYILKTTFGGGESGFDSAFLVFSAGVVSIGVVIVLMYMYQTRFGSLYLHIGVISSVFMVGLTAGAVLIRRLLAVFGGIRQRFLLFAAMLVHVALIGAIAFLPVEHWGHAIFAIGFCLCGLCCGCYFPLAAKQMADCGFEVGQAASKLEVADHIGASVGGLVTSLALVPVVGTQAALFILSLVILANVPAAFVRVTMGQPGFAVQASRKATVPTGVTVGLRMRRISYVLFGVAATVLVCSNMLTAAGSKLRPSLPQYAAQALAGQMSIAPASAVMQKDGRQINYFKVYAAQEEPAGYIFSSADFAPDVRGFGGKMNLAIYTGADGKLLNFHILRSNETPAYLELISRWCAGLSGRELFGPKPFADVDVVTGATISSEAVLAALEKSAQSFAAEALGHSFDEGTASAGQKKPTAAYWRNYIPDRTGIYLMVAAAMSLVVIYYGGFWTRIAVLCGNVLVGGVILNAQYSSEQAAGLLSLHTPAIGLSGAFLLAVGMVLLLICFGNIYCGYLCPFGAAQELLGLVVPKRLRWTPSAEKMRQGRFVKYVVLFILVLVFFISRDRTTLGADPLIAAFSRKAALYTTPVLVVGAAVLAISVFITRFWCRYLCPVGAFLSLFNAVVLLKKYVPAKKFGRCEFGLTGKDNLDCIYCDRCRYQPKARAETEPIVQPAYAPANVTSRYFLAGVAALAIIFCGVSVHKFLEVVPSGFEQAAISAASGGQPRDVDMQRIRTMIERQMLSDREAEFYKKLEQQ
jgi:spermidine synthase